MLNNNQSAKPLSVLVVDDEASIRDLVIQVLELNYHVYSATNSAEALRIAKEHKPSFILADIYICRDKAVLIFAELFVRTARPKIFQ